MKTCAKCNIEKPYEEFKRDRTKPDGFYSSCRACNKVYWDAVKGTMSVVRSERRAKDPEKYKAQARARYARKTEQYKQHHRNWGKRNPGYLKAAKMAKRRVLRRSPGKHTVEQWERLKQLHGNRCLCCGRPNGPPQSDSELTRDHVIPTAHGGRNDIGNIQPICRACNSKKGNRTIDYRPKQSAA